jgi:predicted enzyme related to lactoylglutathione lyase
LLDQAAHPVIDLKSLYYYIFLVRRRFMMNFIVEDLDGLLAALCEERVEVDPRREEYDYGRFAWIMDPEGNRIELWEPPKR